MNAHVAVKFIYVRLFRGTGSMHTRSFTARATWTAICGALWILSWIIAEGIPIFNDVVGLAVCVDEQCLCLWPRGALMANCAHRVHFLPVGFHSAFQHCSGSI